MDGVDEMRHRAVIQRALATGADAHLRVGATGHTAYEQASAYFPHLLNELPPPPPVLELRRSPFKGK